MAGEISLSVMYAVVPFTCSYTEAVAWFRDKADAEKWTEARNVHGDAIVMFAARAELSPPLCLKSWHHDGWREGWG